MAFSHLFSDTLSRNTPNIIREIAKRLSDPEFISFAGGNPAESTFPVEEIQKIASTCLVDNRTAAFQYGTTQGNLKLRELIAEDLAKKGIDTKPSEIMLTTGSQQGIDLCGKVFINPGDNVWVENPTYLAAIQIYKVYNACFNTVITDKDGMDIDALKQGAAENGGKLVYTVPTFQNPTGKSLSLERRKAIIECLEDNDMILVEDDPYSDLRYEGEVLPPIKSFDTSGRVVYLGSFSKTIAPGLRTGYIVANEEILAKMMVGKQTVDLHSNALSQVLIYEYLKSETYDAHLESIKLLYKNKRDKMLNLMQAHFPDCAKWEKPQGGMFIWVEFPQGVSMTEFLSVAMDEKIAFIPGASFYALGGTDNTMRLNFSNSTEADMEKGIKKLGELLKKLFNK